jgi:hypothetical protein
LIADPRWDDDFHYGFEMEFDEDGNRVFQDGHTCLGFQAEAEKIKEGIVPVSIVL